MPNQNVFLTLSGHVHGVGLNIKRDVGVKGRTVVEMVANHQFFEIERRAPGRPPPAAAVRPRRGAS